MFSPTQSGGAKHMCFLERHVSDLPLSRKIQTCVREIGAAAAATSPLPSFFFLLVFGRHGHWAAPERLHPGGRARPPLITYERTKSRTNEIYGGRYGPEGPGESAEGTTAATHASCD